MTDKKTSLLKLISELHRKSYIGKNNHYSAARRNNKFNNWTGLSIILINISLGSGLLMLFRIEITKIFIWVGAALSFVSAALGGTKTFFNYQKRFEIHRRTAAKFLDIEHRCDFLTKSISNNFITINDAVPKYEELNNLYLTIIQDALDFPTSTRDFKKSLKLYEKKINK